MSGVSNLDEQASREADEMDVLTAAIELDPERLTGLLAYAQRLVDEQRAQS